MAFSINPTYTYEFELDTLTPQQFLCLAVEAVRKAGWKISAVHDNFLIAYTGFSLSSWSEEIKITFLNDKAVIKSSCTGRQMADWGKNKRNVTTLTAFIHELKSAETSEELYATFEKTRAEFAVQDDEMLLAQGDKKSGGLLSIFKPVEGYFITPILINLNILVFILMCIGGANVFLPDTEILVEWGANFRPVTLNGQWWRLLTCNFLHIGVFHLLMNMYALLYIGTLLEPLLGKSKFLLAYILTGIISSLLSLYWHDYIVSAGASGAIFGMYGVFLAMLTTNFIEKAARATFLSSILIFVGYNLLNGMKVGIDNAAHIGGLLCGLFIGYCYYPVLKDPLSTQLRNGVMVAVSVIVLLVTISTYTSLDSDLLTFTRSLEEFEKKENTALEFYSMPENTDKKTRLKKLKQGVRLWFDNVTITKKAMMLNLPDYHRNQNMVLQQYCYNRIKTYNTLYKAIDENSDQYNNLIENYDLQTASLLDKLKSPNN